MVSGVAHLADEDDIEVLAGGGLEGFAEGVGIDADLALDDHRLFYGVHELDRFLDGEYMFAKVCIDVINNGS